MSDEKNTGILGGFRDFILRGNVIDLAVAVVIGAAFTAIVTAIVTYLINPAIGAVFNASSLNESLIVEIPTVSGETAQLGFGAILGAVIQFVIVAAVVYFALVVPVNHLKKVAFAKQKAEEEAVVPADLPPTETELLAQIRDLLAAQADSDKLPSGLPPAGKHAGDPTA
jgi:large conductance mechanosensitive channel